VGKDFFLTVAQILPALLIAIIVEIRLGFRPLAVDRDELAEAESEIFDSQPEAVNEKTLRSNLVEDSAYSWAVRRQRRQVERIRALYSRSAWLFLVGEVACVLAALVPVLRHPATAATAGVALVALSVTAVRLPMKNDRDVLRGLEAKPKS
jgi:hypothetical protein